MKYPLVSVIVPCYNNQNYIKEALNSVLSQDYPRLEVIVVDDGSTDDSLQIVNEYKDRINIITQPNQGPSVARNTGLKAATGDYIAFCDSDDLWLPGKITAQVNYLEQHRQYGLCFSNFFVWDQNKSLPDVLSEQAECSASDIDPDLSGWLYLLLLEDSYIHTTTAMLRREVLEVVGFFNETYRIGEDHDFWIRISRKYPMVKLKKKFSVYRDIPASITKKVHVENFSLKILESAISQYGLICPSGKAIKQAQVNQYLGERHFTYGYNALLQGYQEKAFYALRQAVKYRYRLMKSLLLSIICSNKLTSFLFLQFKKRHNK